MKRRNPWPKGKSRKAANSARKAWATRKRRYGKKGHRKGHKPGPKKRKARKGGKRLMRRK